MENNHKKVNLFIVGAQRSGTTFLNYYLEKHPDVFFCPVKEPNFFTNLESPFPSDYLIPNSNEKVIMRFIKKIDDYQKLFENVKNEKIIAEGSVSYLRDFSSPIKIKNYNKEAKIIIILRNPVERIKSHYLMTQSVSHQTLPIIKGILEDNMKDEIHRQGYIDYGMYYKQISNYKKYFDDRNILILNFKELSSDPHVLFSKICSFLNIDFSFYQNIEFKKKYSTVSLRFKAISRLRKRLKDSYVGFYLYKFLFHKPLVSNFLKFIFYKENNSKKFSKEEEEFLSSLYKEEIEKLKSININL